MKKHECYTGVVEKMNFPNKGMVCCEEEDAVVLVKNAFPGQKIRFALTKNREKKKEGRLMEILEYAENETETPPCIHFGACGGCSYQRLSYEEQKKFKLQQVQALFENIYPEFPLRSCKSSPNVWKYRNKMEFSFGDEEKGGALRLGLHKQGSFYDILNTDGCQIIHEDFRTIMRVTLDYFSKKNVTYMHKRTHEGFLRHLMLRRGETSGELLICLVTTSQPGCDLEEWKERLLSASYEGKVQGILQIVNDSLADIVQSDETRVLFGQDYFVDEILGLTFQISPFSFFQTNSSGCEVLYSLARDYIGEIQDKVVFDLYSGTGTIAQVLAPVAKEVIGVEIVEEAVLAARENAKKNGLSNCRFIAGDVLKVLADITEKPDFIVIDPPREGVHPKALKQIIEYGVERIVYISCKPTSLARDIEAFLEGGYIPVKAECVDMFPWTRGIETVCLLSKLHADQHIEVELNMDELDLTAAESKATYEEIREYVLKHNGLKVSNLYIAQVKQKCGIIERVNYNLPKSENSRQPKCPSEKETAIRGALEHFRMI